MNPQVWSTSQYLILLDYRQETLQVDMIEEKSGGLTEEVHNATENRI